MKLERSHKIYLIEFTAQELRDLIHLIHLKHDKSNEDMRLKYIQALTDIRDEKLSQQLNKDLRL